MHFVVFFVFARCARKGFFINELLKNRLVGQDYAYNGYCCVLPAAPKNVTSWELSGRRLGGDWEATGRRLAGGWQAAGRRLGVPSERMTLTSSNSTTAQAEEVHIYLKN